MWIDGCPGEEVSATVNAKEKWREQTEIWGKENVKGQTGRNQGSYKHYMVLEHLYILEIPNSVIT